MPEAEQTLLIKGGRVYDHAGDTDSPAAADVLIAGDTVAAVEPGLAARIEAGEAHPALGGAPPGRVIDAGGRLLVPGFVNAHYHSHDVLLKGCFETIHREAWLLNSLPPNYPRRSREELRARTLLGALECLRSGITTVQDMCTVYPFDEGDLDVILDAYDEIGIRCVFAPQVADVQGAALTPFWEEVVPAEYQSRLTGPAGGLGGQGDLFDVVRDVTRARRGRHRRITWALGPTSPERSSPELLAKLAGLAESDDLPVYTHINESRASTLAGRQLFGAHDGSLVRYLDDTGLLGPRLNLAHAVWMKPDEIEAIADAGAMVIFNPVGNMKTRSGVAPIRRFLDAGVGAALGCDNCSCSDAQNMFLAMKMFAGLGAAIPSDPGPPYATDALAAATVNGARTARLEGEIGAIAPAMKADLFIVDLTDVSFVPLNSAARQLVFTESGRAVETVIVDGRIILFERRAETIDEAALRQVVEDCMIILGKDLEAVQARTDTMEEYLLEAWRRAWAEDIGVERFVNSGRG
ncbi:MAG: amidohydrolase family protein [Rhodospirillales bacterium]|jgi:guanine deaminase|nr:amidohydrolase family protein [Rhodospirillales bacterium]MDP6774182.1 amidohydrolase family protein [Rhodospirillales bacterium]